MSSKTLIMVTTTIGTYLGSYIPTLWGASMFSLTSVALGAVGGILGIYVGYRLGEW